MRIAKQPDGYKYKKFEEGDILDHIRAQQPRYLGAVFAVVREWHAAGKPRTEDTRHDFKGWAQTLDWIVQNVLNAKPLLEGHRETQARMTSPALNWLREVTILINRQGKCGQWLLASDILDSLDESGEIEIPSFKNGADIEDPMVRKQALSQIGKQLKRCFAVTDKVELDGLAVDRQWYKDEQYRDRCKYIVYRLGNPMPYVPF